MGDSCAAHLAVVPEQLRDGGNDVRVVVAALERVHALAAPLRPRRHADGLCVQHPRRGALLRAHMQVVCQVPQPGASLLAESCNKPPAEDGCMCIATV